ncbi:MAG: hypothetical protein QW084_00095 [Candidatus Hadarchaeales archaeon]
MAAGREAPGGCGKLSRDPLQVQLDHLEQRIRRLERWRRSREKSEVLMDRYRRLFNPPTPLLEKGEKDIQKLRELMEKKRAETRSTKVGRATGRRLR